MHRPRSVEFDTRGFLFATKALIAIVAVLWAAQVGIPRAGDVYVARMYDTSALDARIADIRTRNRARQEAAALAAFERERTLCFVGDILFDRGIARVVRERDGDYMYPFARIKNELAGCDLLFGNLEGPVSSRGEDRGGLYSFRMAPDTADALAAAGFDIVSVANNHIADWGDEAMYDTFTILREARVQYVGAGVNSRDAYEPRFVNVGDTTVGFVAFSDIYGMYRKSVYKNKPKLALLTQQYVREGITDAREEADIVIVSIHFGEEYQTEPNERQKEFARAAIDAGADVVIGHHPHSVQPVERYKDGIIAYSVGNFIFDQNFSKETQTGLLVKVAAERGRIRAVDEDLLRFTDDYQPYVATK